MDVVYDMNRAERGSSGYSSVSESSGVILLATNGSDAASILDGAAINLSCSSLHSAVAF